VVAAMFAVIGENIIGIHQDEYGARMIFSHIPQTPDGGGWLYTCPENPEHPFQEVIVRGQHTNKWVSFDKVAVSTPEFIPGLKALVEQYQVQAYVLTEGIDPEIWRVMDRDASYSEQLDFTQRQVMAGHLRHLHIA
jgi:hypothetical protein